MKKQKVTLQHFIEQKNHLFTKTYYLSIMAAEKKDNQIEDRKFDLNEIKTLLEDTAHPFDFDDQVKLLTEYKTKKFEKTRLDAAQKIVYDALNWFSGEPSKGQFQAYVHDVKHPSEDIKNPEWIKNYLSKYLCENYNVGIAECSFSTVDYPQRIIIIKQKQQ